MLGGNDQILKYLCDGLKKLQNLQKLRLNLVGNKLDENNYKNLGDALK